MRLVISLVTIALCAALVGSIYRWKLRPLLLLHPQYKPWIELADSRLLRAWEWIKIRKLEAVAGAAMVLPEIPDLVNELAGFDWTPFGTLGTGVARALGIAALVCKFVLLKRTIGG
jgi:hypothetical protein